MHITRFHISDVLESICKSLEGITDKVYSGKRPDAVQEQQKSFLVVSVPVGLDDQNAWQRGTLRISIYVRNKANGIENTKKLDAVLNAVAAKFPLVGERYSATNPSVVLKGYDGVAFDVWHVQCRLIINTTDSYVYP